MGDPADARALARFFKTGPGDYGAGDRFLGIRVPALRALVRELGPAIPLPTLRMLLASPWHEARMLGLLLMVARFRRADDAEQRRLYDFYLSCTNRINNWDLVDASAPNIVGAWLAVRDRAPLDRLARSPVLWERRIAMVSTLALIRRGDLSATFRLAVRLMGDPHDLIHKATGWMLREAGKRDLAALRDFLDRHEASLPRTALRYAIERLPEAERRRRLRAAPARLSTRPGRRISGGRTRRGPRP